MASTRTQLKRRIRELEERVSELEAEIALEYSSGLTGREPVRASLERIPSLEPVPGFSVALQFG